MNAIIANPEEAANVATEFIYSIDNLPNEVAHLLQEIKYREARTVELQQEIDKDAAKYIRHSRRATSALTPMPLTTMNTASGSTPSTPFPDSPSNSSSRAESVTPLTNGSAISIPTKISACYTEIHDLAVEKCTLAERLIEIITRTRAKLDVDIAKVRLLQGDPPELVAAQVSATANLKPAGMVGLATLPLSAGGTANVEAFGAPGRNPALAISESLRNALSNQPLTEGGGARSALAAGLGTATPTASSSPAVKKRRTTTTTSIKISPAASPAKHRSASPSSVPTPVHTQQKSRLSRQLHPVVVEDIDMDADGDGDDEDADMEEDNEDETPYCFCQKQSYGDMIACDNEGGCPYEWFHLACVGLKIPTPERWFCAVCIKDKGLTQPQPPPPSTARKGRKK